MTTEYGPCDDWDVQWPCEISAGSEALTGSAVAFATEVVWALSDRQFGFCDVTLRPCRKSCYDAPWPDPEFSWPGRSWLRAALISGRWYNITCGGGSCSGSDCSCTPLSQVYLPSVVSEVLEVKVDGAILDPSAYRLDNGRILVRLDGEDWPRCNDLNLADTEPDTWSVTARFGREVPEGGAWAVGELACEFVKAMSGEDCRLPAHVTQIARQGVTITFPDASQFFERGLTGLYMVDIFIRTWNPSGLRRRSRVFNVDDPWPRRTGA